MVITFGLEVEAAGAPGAAGGTEYWAYTFGKFATLIRSRHKKITVGGNGLGCNATFIMALHSYIYMRLRKICWRKKVGISSTETIRKQHFLCISVLCER